MKKKNIISIALICTMYHMLSAKQRIMQASALVTVSVVQPVVEPITEPVEVKSCLTDFEELSFDDDQEAQEFEELPLEPEKKSGYLDTAQGVAEIVAVQAILGALYIRQVCSDSYTWLKTIFGSKKV